MAFDAHTHLDFEAFAPDRAAVCERARQAGVDGWLIAGAAPADWDRIERVAAETGGLAACGVHPWWLSELGEDAVQAALADLGQRDGLAAIGETGLDHVRAQDATTRTKQRECFREHLSIARNRNLPLVLHLVRASTEALQLCRLDGLPEAGGMIHRWSGKPTQIAGAVSQGLYISFGPAVLGKRASKQWEALRRVPLDQLLFETDCPDQPLEGKQRGEPADVLAVIAKAAQVLRVEPAALAEQTADNARRLFRVG